MGRVQLGMFEHSGFPWSNGGFSLDPKTITIITSSQQEAQAAEETKGPKGLSESQMAGARCCGQHLIHLISVASLARLENQAPYPLHENSWRQDGSDTPHTHTRTSASTQTYHTTHTTHHTTRHTQPTTHNPQPTTHNTQHPTHNTQHTTHAHTRPRTHSCTYGCTHARHARTHKHMKMNTHTHTNTHAHAHAHRNTRHTHTQYAHTIRTHNTHTHTHARTHTHQKKEETHAHKHKHTNTQTHKRTSTHTHTHLCPSKAGLQRFSPRVIKQPIFGKLWANCKLRKRLSPNRSATSYHIGPSARKHWSFAPSTRSGSSV